MSYQCPACGGGLAHRFRRCPHCGASRAPQVTRSRPVEVLKSAYLIGLLDTTTKPPRLKSMGIYSEPSPTLNGFPVKVLETRGVNYGSARAALLQALHESPWLTWAYQMLPERERVPQGVLHPLDAEREP